MEYILAKRIVNNFRKPSERNYSKYVKSVDKYGTITWTRDYSQAMPIVGKWEAQEKINLLYALGKINTPLALYLEKRR